MLSIRAEISHAFKIVEAIRQVGSRLEPDSWSIVFTLARHFLESVKTASSRSQHV